jgi:hypothetical protein
MVDIPINDVSRRVQFTSSGSAGPYSFSFAVLDQDDLAVYQGSTLKTLTTHYTVSLNANGTGTITFTSGNAPASGVIVTIASDQAVARTSDYTAGGDFKAATINDDLDKLTINDQQIVSNLNRGIQLRIFANRDVSSDGTGPLYWPYEDTVADQKNKVIAYDNAGTGLVATTSIGTFKGNWAASTSYEVRDLIKDTSNNNIYFCNTAHTSSGSQPISSNTDAAKWSLVVDAASATTSASNAATSATASANSATASAASATSSASSASTSSTQASNASTSASTASTQASNASTSASNAEASAGAFSFKYTFDNSTSMADPGSNGEWRWNNGTVGSVSSLAIRANTADTGNPDISPWIITWDDSTSTVNGHVLFRKSGTPATFAIFQIGAITDNGDWLQIALTHVASNGTWSNADTGYISFMGRNGDKGDTGAQGAQGIQGATGATGPVAEAFKTIAVSGQSSVVADAAEDTLTLVGGDNITVTTNAGTDTVTITGAAAGAGYYLGGSGGASGNTSTGLTEIFRVNNNALATSCTIAANTNASATGPLSVNSGVTVTVTGTLVII